MSRVNKVNRQLVTLVLCIISTIRIGELVAGTQDPLNRENLLIENQTDCADEPKEKFKLQPEEANQNSQQYEAFRWRNDTPLELILNSAPEVYFHRMDEVSMSIEELGLGAIETRLRSTFYSDSFIHKYDTEKELRSAAGPQVDQELCLRQLEHLEERSRRLRAERYDSKDINLYRLFDTYGRFPPGLMSGDTFWPGQYRECTRFQIKMQDESRVGTRYCLASVKHKNWVPNQEDSLRFLKTGVCLPASCDSLDYKNKYELVSQLFEYQTRDVDREVAKLTELYCLPDEQSQLRQWYKQPVALVLVALLSSWLALLAFATYKYEAIKSRVQRVEVASAQEVFGLTTGLKLKQDDAEIPDPNFKLYKTLAVTSNFKRLFDTGSTSSLMETSNKVNGAKRSPASQPKAQLTNKLVDLNVIEGIKVLSMFYVIAGHILMCITQTMTNGREIAYNSSPAFVLANLMPAFAVNSFFVITGLLTSYLLMKQNQSHAFMNDPGKWLAFIVYRYLRIMPMYVLVVAYTKYLAKFAGSGPVWDYGTSSLGQRKVCEQESWWWVLAFGANFKNPMQHCIPSAWYLADDFQFFIVTPIFMAALHQSPYLGKWLLRSCIAIGYVVGVYGIMSSEEEDFRPVAKFEPHGFKYYVTHLAYSYTQPHHRIPAYLVGLLIGYSLHCFERDSLAKAAEAHQREKRRQEYINNNNNLTDDDDELVKVAATTDQKHEWSPDFKYWTPRLCGFFLFLGLITPSVGSRLPFTPWASKVMIAFYMPTYHLLFASAIGLYILLATTGHGCQLIDSILRANFWKPLARLSLCVVLTNIEVVVHYVQSAWQTQYVGTQQLVTLDVIIIILCYMVATVVCVLFEAPIRGGLNHLLSLGITRIANKQKNS